MDDALEEMILAGHSPMRLQGLSLPCYITRPGANRWYVAVCTIDGDHAAKIAGFEPFDGDVTLLPASSQRLVAVGDPWHDVLVWNGLEHVGTPDIILAQLGGELDDISKNAPLTLLDLAVAVDTPDLPERAGAAYRYLEARFDQKMADHWQCELFVRQRTLVELRRLVRKPRSSAVAAAIRLIEVTRNSQGLTIELPPAVAAALEQTQAVEAFLERAKGLSRVAGVNLQLIGVPELRVEPAISELSPVVGNEPDVSEPSETTILVILSGPKARAIGRYLGSPEWRADWNVPDDIDSVRWNRGKTAARRGINTGTTALPRLVTVDDQVALPKLDGIATVIWVADDETVERDWGRSVPAELRAAGEQGLEPLCILAPSLPSSGPSRVLARTSDTYELPPFLTILDTATARSPFWGGNPKRSIDRRVADLVMAAAVLTVPDSPLRAFLSVDRPRYEPLLLSIASGSGRGQDAGAALASEVSSAGLDGFARPLKSAERFIWIERPLDGRRVREQLGRASVHRHRPGFRPFAQAIVSNNRRLVGMEVDGRLTGEVPPRIESALSFPELSAAFRLGKSRSLLRGCIVTAEAPDLKSLRAAVDEEWQICRYSDEDALRDFVADRRSDDWQLPHDIQLPRLNRLGRNKGLAIRGVDPRDVIRFPAEVYEDWRQYAGMEFDGDIRWYRSDQNRYGEPPETAGMVALPVAAFREAEERGHPAAEFLRRALGVLVPAPQSLARRTADLRASWQPPERDARRYMLDDGRLPVRFNRLDEREVAAQKFFTLDGDGSIVALLLSKLFAVWAGATLSRSPSWSSRFSVTKTFETFPIPDRFLVTRDGDAGRASLHLSRSPGPLRQLVRALEEEVQDFRFQFPGRYGRIRVPQGLEEIMDGVDAFLLNEIGLENDADELSILERLVSLNRAA